MAVLTSCKEENAEKDEDKDLYEEVKSTTGYTWYKNNDTIQASSSESAHNDFFRVRFNAIAQAALTDDGKLPVNGSFPDGSIVAKELFNTQDGALQLTAVMKKTNSDNGAGGWLWAEFKADGTVAYSTDEKGAGCLSCHSVNDRDHVRIFELFQ
jgi:hypothetical protein